MMNIFRYEVKSSIGSTLAWIIGIFGVIFLFMAVFPTFGSNLEIAEQIMEYYPKELLKMFGMNETLPLSTVLGYLVFTFVFVQLLLAIQAANVGFSILSVEERELTADFLMCKPVKRSTIFMQKLLAGLVRLAIVNGCTWIATFMSIEMFKDGKTYEAEPILLFLGALFLFQLDFLAIGMLISVLVRKIRNVLSYSMGLAFAMYTINALTSIVGDTFLSIISPFYQYEVGYIISNYSLHFTRTICSLVIIVGSFAISYMVYLKKDIHSL